MFTVQAKENLKAIFIMLGDYNLPERSHLCEEQLKDQDETYDPLHSEVADTKNTASNTPIEHSNNSNNYQ